MICETCRWASTRLRMTAKSILGRSATEVVEQDGLDVLRPDTARSGHEASDLAASDEAASAQLDALEAAGTSPPADRGRGEVDVSGGEDLGCFDEGDPVGGRGHRGQSVLVLEVDAGASVGRFFGDSRGVRVGFAYEPARFALALDALEQALAAFRAREPIRENA